MSDTKRTETTFKWLEKHPALMERLARLQEISTNVGGDLDTLAKAEREVIEEVDRLGAEALKQWLGSRHEAICAEEQSLAGSRRHSKKKLRVTTLLGPVEVEEQIYQRGTKRVRPLCLAAGIEAGALELPVRRFEEFEYRTLNSWSRGRRVIGKAEVLAKGQNPRFVVTNFGGDAFDARALYEDFYCARGDMENRIKEQQQDLFADRTSHPCDGLEPVAAVVLRLRTPDALSVAGARAARHTLGKSHHRNVAPAAVQDRRAGQSQRPAHPLRPGRGLPRSGCLRTGLQKSPGLAFVEQPIVYSLIDNTAGQNRCASSCPHRWDYQENQSFGAIAPDD